MLKALTELAEQNPDILALWLYGSRARGDAGATSDYDLAVIFSSWEPDPLERRLRPEVLALDWQQSLGLPEDQISIVDLACCPAPLGWSVLSEGELLVDKQPEVRMTIESRIHSIWELDYMHPQTLYFQTTSL
ncbi:type VII toxin-antitoxin system MntA family adenylyltransferase antitoxin [Marinospirillum alkaliphilum]|uniref:Nucleotidyltransferase domain-containing protein n=1 Tax=Marinospirillum alkaliphilum DSM 21637 TaxID=1122209 RepID=A0A1K1ZPD7_9GAMM|nr:nucleotidyltransferase domain-containing protein [Marinospirillum alkaliphilum]SFX75920.1 Nucleotidyltransferase domain-containing protein [Marinospirillum alkaliphilum DSM 21637]